MHIDPPTQASLGDNDVQWRDRLVTSLRKCSVQRAPRHVVLQYFITFLVLIGLAVVARVMAAIIDNGIKDPDYLVPAYVVAVFIAIAVLARIRNRFLRKAWQTAARSAEDELNSSGGRRPILYLRSFRLDDRVGRPSWLERYLGVRPLRTMEQILAKDLRKLGPVIAIGRPDERLPPLGAARFYVRQEIWQETVIEVAKASKLIVLATGVTEGLRWEISHLIENVPAEKLILWAHPHLLRVGAKKREVEWTKFRETLGGSFPKPLPTRLGDARFIDFTPDWEPRAAAVLAGSVGSVLDHPQSVALKALLQVKQGMVKGADEPDAAPIAIRDSGPDLADLIGASRPSVSSAHAFAFLFANIAGNVVAQLPRSFSAVSWGHALVSGAVLSGAALIAFRYIRATGGAVAVAAALGTLGNALYVMARQEFHLGVQPLAEFAGLMLWPFAYRLLFFAGLAWAARRVTPLWFALWFGPACASLAFWLGKFLVARFTGSFFPMTDVFVYLLSDAAFAVCFTVGLRFATDRPR